MSKFKKFYRNRVFLSFAIATTKIKLCSVNIFILFSREAREENEIHQ